MPDLKTLIERLCIPVDLAKAFLAQGRVAMAELGRSAVDAAILVFFAHR
jgi:hypothetical protein